MSGTKRRRDWTVSANGAVNSSVEFLALVGAVEDILKNHRLGTPLERTARLIVAQLAHTYGLAPTEGR